MFEKKEPSTLDIDPRNRIDEILSALHNLNIEVAGVEDRMDLVEDDIRNILITTKLLVDRLASLDDKLLKILTSINNRHGNTDNNAADNNGYNNIENNWFDIMAKHCPPLGDETDVWPVRMCHQWLRGHFRGPDAIPELAQEVIPADFQLFARELAKHARERGLSPVSVWRYDARRRRKEFRTWIRGKLGTSAPEVWRLFETPGIKISSGVRLFLLGCDRLLAEGEPI